MIFCAFATFFIIFWRNWFFRNLIFWFKFEFKIICLIHGISLSISHGEFCRKFELALGWWISEITCFFIIFNLLRSLIIWRSSSFVVQIKWLNYCWLRFNNRLPLLIGRNILFIFSGNICRINLRSSFIIFICLFDLPFNLDNLSSDRLIGTPLRDLILIFDKIRTLGVVLRFSLNLLPFFQGGHVWPLIFLILLWHQNLFQFNSN